MGRRRSAVAPSAAAATLEAAEPISAEPRGKPERPRRDGPGWAWYESVGSPTQWLAPLVDYSDPAFRLLCRRYGAEMCSTPMIDEGAYSKYEDYRERYKFLGEEDRPLIAQFGGSDPEALARCAAMVAPYVDAVELNLGCPQRCARAGGFGAFLMESPEKAAACVRAIAAALRTHNMGMSPAKGNGTQPYVACLCKIRCFDEISRTLAFASMLQDSGCECLTVHGRTRMCAARCNVAKKPLANWDWIAEVKRHARIPVISNGNIRHRADVEACFATTGADGVMSGVGALCRPAAVFVRRRTEGELEELPAHPALVAASYVELASRTGAEPQQVFVHLVGKLAVLDQSLLLGRPALQQRFEALDTSATWSGIPARSRPPALIEALRGLALKTPDFCYNDVQYNDGQDDGGGEWTFVWRDKRF